ncbi:DUF6705 family protein [Elizabethkingia miricola]|uniref:DUF6705 domain-containing protein n=1 Tax=Elizabethkingia miricola TaxID=172045 RepID=A0ABD5B4H4_ELIMR|nr:DUF6705 family protein [Elizabethkingia miricola]MDQ8748551.1 hypothetical protein [Elizabethkingia miricola]OPB88179.1 hypothetical protein BAS06_13470 [Elizabethkingia miricola]
MKTHLAVIIVLLSNITVFAQTLVSPQIKADFEGTWVYKRKHYSSTIILKFEKGKDYANFIDVGTGEAPEERFRAQIKNGKLVIPPYYHRNDSKIEMEVIKSKLYFRQQLVLWDKNNNPVEIENAPVIVKIFKRVNKK